MESSGKKLEGVENAQAVNAPNPADVSEQPTSAQQVPAPSSAAKHGDSTRQMIFVSFFDCINFILSNYTTNKQSSQKL